jgi:hypothetical protein
VRLILNQIGRWLTESLEGVDATPSRQVLLPRDRAGVR